MAGEQPIRQENVGVDQHWLDLPEDVIRSGIEAMPPGARKDQAYSDWARARILKENANPSTTRDVEDNVRSVVRGVPGVGPFLDEASAGLTAINPMSSSNYAEQIPYWRQRDQQFQKNFPVRDFSLGLAGGVGATAPLMGAGPGFGAIANTIAGTIGGFGEGEGSPLTEAGIKSRGGSALATGVGTGILSAATGPASNYFGRFAQGSVSPEIEAALARLNINNSPYFVSANDALTQAQGRRNAQTNVGSPLNQRYGETRDQFGRAAGDIVRRETGAAGPPTAPWTAGQTIDTALRRSAEGSERSMGVLGNEITSQMPPGATYDPAAHRGALENIIRTRTGEGMVNPEAGLANDMSFSTAPRTWEGSSSYNTRLGQRIGLPETEASAVPRAELEQLYAGHQGTDRPNFVESILGPQGRQRFQEITEQQRLLGEHQRGIGDLLSANATPEQLVSTLLSGGSTKGGPTNLNAVDMILQALAPSERQQAAGGVLGQIVNQNQVAATRGTQVGNATNPGGVADAINKMVPYVREALFPQGHAAPPIGADAEALRLVGQRIGQVNQYSNVGSAATVGDQAMKQAPIVGQAINSALKLIGIPQIKNALDTYLANYGLPTAVTSALQGGLASGARLTAEGAAPYVQQAAPRVYDQAVQLKNMLPR